MVIFTPWWYSQSTIRTASSMDRLRELTSGMNTVRASIDNLKSEWQNVTSMVNTIFNENITLLAEHKEALETIETLKRQLNLRSKMIKEICEFMDHEKLYTDKWNKKHDALVEEALHKK